MARVKKKEEKKLRPHPTQSPPIIEGEISDGKLLHIPDHDSHRGPLRSFSNEVHFLPQGTSRIFGISGARGVTDTGPGGGISWNGPSPARRSRGGVRDEEGRLVVCVGRR